MKKTRLVAGLTFSVIVATAHAAKYSVVEIPLDDKGVNTFPTAINAEGQMSVNIQAPFNPPIDVSLIDFESQTLIDNLTDIDSARGGQPNTEDYVFLYNLISTANASSPNQLFQQISSLHSYVADDDSAEFIPGYDQKSADSNEYTFSTDTNIRAVNDAGYTTGGGQDMFYTLPYTDESGVELNYVLNDFLLRAFATVNGSTVELPPIATQAGGLSDAFDINNSNQVVGFASTENASEDFQTALDNCEDEELRADVPLESCRRSLMLSSAFSTAFQQRGMIWQLDDIGNVVSSKALGLLLTPEADDEVVYVSQALAINDNGIAVGLASGLYQDSENVSTFAAIFDGDSVSEITDDQDYFRSVATDINNGNIVVGHAFKSINGANRSKFFVHDINSGDTQFPEDFFLGSASVATAINNSGVIVGYGQVEASVGNAPRRTAGFIYDDNSQEFQNINSLLQCGSSFSIVQANGINDANEIAATAVIQKPARDIRGELLLDSDGAELLVDRIVAVKLMPISGGTIEDCDVDDQVLDRQGAGIGWLSIFALLLLGTRLRSKL